ncbi:hypothetical protein FCK90_06625 [Kocuria coralli]|uniref:Uncharacterized protein n=1 Tax=Kocuria coralli TaxID=1461025 RepID=A0A5J5KY98_9MICC|nr:hypothetical protein [Kocuria coralli]KAA9394492.1 hypothetical protein FCK90_06625 [Kocuria coralli]
MAKIRARSTAVTAPAVAALMLALSACGGDDVGTEPRAGTKQEGSAQEQVMISPEGDGPIGLTAPSIEGDSETVSGRMIVGPGECFSLQDEGQPELLVFPEGKEFVISGDRPSATTEGTGTVQAGERVEFDTVAVPLEETEGLPDQCSQGVADTIHVVQG